MARGPDYQKQEAKRSLYHLKRSKSNVRGRLKDKRLVKEQLDPSCDYDFELEKEIQEALDCHYYGPCDKCLSRESDG